MFFHSDSDVNEILIESLCCHYFLKFFTASNCGSSNFVLKNFNFTFAIVNQTMKKRTQTRDESQRKIQSSIESNAKGSQIHSQSHFTRKRNLAKPSDF